MKYSLLDRRVETNGVLPAAQELGVTIIAYSPLEQGVLTGRFHGDRSAVARLHGPRKLLKWFRTAGLEQSTPLIDGLRRSADRHAATVAQVALAWLIQRHGRSVVTIPGASSVAQMQSNATAMELALEREELEEIDALSRRVAGDT